MSVPIVWVTNFSTPVMDFEPKPRFYLTDLPIMYRTRLWSNRYLLRPLAVSPYRVADQDLADYHWMMHTVFAGEPLMKSLFNWWRDTLPYWNRCACQLQPSATRCHFIVHVNIVICVLACLRIKQLADAFWKGGWTVRQFECRSVASGEATTIMSQIWDRGVDSGWFARDVPEPCPWRPPEVAPDSPTRKWLAVFVNTELDGRAANDPQRCQICIQQGTVCCRC
jgi:hypothetical protein